MSCSRTFRKPKTAEEEKNLIEEAIPKTTHAVRKRSVKIFLEWQNGRKHKNPAIVPCDADNHLIFISHVQCLYI